MTLLTVTLNAAVDKIYTVPGFAVDRVQRPVETRTFAGGKGINVARVTRTLGGDVTATGFLGGRSGEQIRQYLDSEAIAHDFVMTAGESRVCSAIVDPDNRTETVLNEQGPFVAEYECRALLRGLRELLPRCRTVVLSGSLPPGVPPDFYADVIRLAQEFGVLAVLDASGDALQHGIIAMPFMVKPNVQEIEALSVDGDGWGGSALALRSQYGIELALVTGGARGAVLASAEGVWEAAPPPVEAVSALGSGDSLTAGFVWAWGQGWSYAEALKLGVAAGAANALVYGSGFCTHHQIFEMASRTTVNKIG